MAKREKISQETQKGPGKAIRPEREQTQTAPLEQVVPHPPHRPAVGFSPRPASGAPPAAASQASSCAFPSTQRAPGLRSSGRGRPLLHPPLAAWNLSQHLRGEVCLSEKRSGIPFTLRPANPGSPRPTGRSSERGCETDPWAQAAALPPLPRLSLGTATLTAGAEGDARALVGAAAQRGAGAWRTSGCGYPPPSQARHGGPGRSDGAQGTVLHLFPAV